MSGWQHTTLGALCRFVGGQGFPPEYQGLSHGDVPFIKVSDMELPANGRWITTANNWLTGESLAAGRFKPQPSGAIVFAKIGEAIKRERVRVLTRPTVIDNNMMAAIPGAVDSEFLFNLLRFIPFAKDHGGTSLPYLRQGDLAKIEAFVPPLEEQERIAGVLGAFDDLIETNRRLASQLDQARTARVAAALAGSSFETRLSDDAAFVNGRNFTKGADGNGRPVIRTPEVRSGPVGNTVWSSVDADADRVANAGDILFVWSGTLMVNRWLYTEGLVNQHVFKVIPNGVPDWYVYALIEAQLSWFLGLAKDKATTMGHIQRAHLDEPMIGLDPKTIQSLGGAIEPLWSAALDLRIEAQDLARQRDELLPLLMSGRVRVRDVEAAVS